MFKMGPHYPKSFMPMHKAIKPVLLRLCIVWIGLQDQTTSRTVTLMSLFALPVMLLTWFDQVSSE